MKRKVYYFLLYLFIGLIISAIVTRDRKSAKIRAVLDDVSHRPYPALLKHSASFYCSAEGNTDVMATIPSGSLISLISFLPSNNRWKVEYQGSTGFIEDAVIQRDSLYSIKRGMETKPFEMKPFKITIPEVKPRNFDVKPLDFSPSGVMQVPQLAFSSSDARKDSLYWKYGIDTGYNIAEGCYWRGMPDSLTLESLGKPDNVEKTQQERYDEMWRYDSFKLILFFKNHHLDSYQNLEE